MVIKICSLLLNWWVVWCAGPSFVSINTPICRTVIIILKVNFFIYSPTRTRFFTPEERLPSRKGPLLQGHYCIPHNATTNRDFYRVYPVAHQITTIWRHRRTNIGHNRRCTGNAQNVCEAMTDFIVWRTNKTQDGAKKNIVQRSEVLNVPEDQLVSCCINYILRNDHGQSPTCPVILVIAVIKDSWDVLGDLKIICTVYCNDVLVLTSVTSWWIIFGSLCTPLRPRISQQCLRPICHVLLVVCLGVGPSDALHHRNDATRT